MSNALATISKKSPGRPKKIKLERVPELLPVIDVDWTLQPETQIKNLPCKDYKQGEVLGWNTEDVKAVNKSLGMYNTVPMLCGAQKCFWAEMCPSKKYDYPFEGYRCPLEIIEIWNQFVRYVRELDLDPSDQVDLIMTADLVRLDIQIKRIDQHLQIEGMMNDQPAGVDTHGGKLLFAKNAHQLLTQQRGLRKDRNQIFAELVASRKEREKMELAKGKQEENAMGLLERFQAAFANSGNKSLVTIQEKKPDEEILDVEIKEDDSDIPF